MRETATHVDNFQVADGAAPQSLKVIRHQAYMAEGNAGAQGFFGGGNGWYIGYIDNNSTFGSYSGQPGNVLTITEAVVAKYLVPTTRLVGDNFNGMVQVIKSPSSIVGQYLLSASNVKVPLGNISTAPFNNLTISGWCYNGYAGNGMTFRGISQTSTITAWTNTRFAPALDTLAWSYFTGFIVGTNMTITEFTSGFALGPPMEIYFANGTRLQSGKTFVGLVAGYGTTGPFTLNVAFSIPTPVALKASSDIPQAGVGPTMSVVEVDYKPLYESGPVTFSSGFMWASYPHGQASFRTLAGALVGPPSTITFVPNSTFFGVSSNDFTGSCFAEGDPEIGTMALEKINASTWAAMSFDEVIATHVAAFTPKVGGPLTSGSTDYGAFTRDGLWNDGSGLQPYN